MPRANDVELQLRDLRLLQVMLSEGSLTRAANLLDTSQPTLSKSLARLRAHFGDPLLVRHGQAMRPTPRGSEILAPLRDLLSAADGLAHPVTTPFDPRGSDRRFRILVSDVGMVRFLPPLTAHLTEAGPGLKLEAQTLDSRNMETKLASGEADLALGAYAKAPRDLRRQLLYTDSYSSVVRRDHPKRQRLARLAEFCAARHILVVASDIGHSAHQVAQQTIESTIAADHMLLQLPSFTAAALVAAETDGVATVPTNLARLLKDRLQLATFRPPVAMPPIAVAQYWHERYHRDPGHRWLRQACFGLFARRTP
ncbi:LysR family transcriptional regulator [Bradyrhizobium lablabi]|uniref:LysR family transcriptional regulator n=1 Tax=Bradyrhizobium lablabi TaxID=722472 RepID=UPI001BA6F43F|nr:LysR family transcriptional regulator [Bradyrhizobium lablabi]MBR0697748.1 LysR family transcriptional regulator [Bradyrhizobium lablabi]